MAPPRAGYKRTWCFQEPAQGHLVLANLRDCDLHDDQHRLLHDRVARTDGEVDRSRCRKWTHGVSEREGEGVDGEVGWWEKRVGKWGWLLLEIKGCQRML